MQHWEILIIPLIALGVWLLGTLFKDENEAAKRAPRRPGSPPGRGPARRPVTDLDRFLEEARRRREAEERRKVPPAPPPRPATTRAPLSERPSRNLDVPSRPVPTSRRTEEAPVPLPVSRPVPQPATIREAAAEAALLVPRPQPLAEAPPPPPPATPATTRDTRPSPIVQQVRALLSKPQSAGTAFVLREIFDRPRCQRRR
jgi:hypothetical protein